MEQHRSTQRCLPKGRADEERLIADMIELTRQYGRYDYRRIAAFLREGGRLINDKRVERLWRCGGLKVSMKQPKKGRIRVNRKLNSTDVIDALTDLFILRWRASLYQI